MAASPGRFYVAVVRYRRGSVTRVDFADLDSAISFGRDRAFDPAVKAVRIERDGVAIWAAASLATVREYGEEVVL